MCYHHPHLYDHKINVGKHVLCKSFNHKPQFLGHVHATHGHVQCGVQRGQEELEMGEGWGLKGDEWVKMEMGGWVGGVGWWEECEWG